MNAITAEARSRLGDRRFFLTMSVAALLLVLLGFGTSYFFWPLTRATHSAAGRPLAASLPLLIHLHAILFGAWMVLLVVQSGLVGTGRIGWHRRLGAASVALVPLMLATGWATAVHGARRGWNPVGRGDALNFMFVGVADLIIFGTLAAAGLALRRRPDLHKRLMLYATLGGLLWPAITRIPGFAGKFPWMFGLLAVVVLAPATRDIWNRVRVRWVTLALALGVLASLPLRRAIGTSATWHAFAEWVVR